MSKYITIEQYNELSNGSFMFNREYFNEFLERTTGIKAQKYEAYSYYDENGNYIGDSKKMNIVELLKNADIKVTDDIVPVIHGKWIKDETSYYPDDYYCVYHDYNCSNCGEIVNDRHQLPKYCPYCGVKMELSEEL